MSVESSASNISQLDPSQPSGNDFIAEGDDHLRLIKRCIKTTFSKITDLVNISHTQLNKLAAAMDTSNSASITLYGNITVDSTNGITLSQTPAKPVENALLTNKQIQDMIHPVGSILTTTKDGNPATYLGFGQWEVFSAGRHLIGVGVADGKAIKIGETGGKYRTTLSASNIPSHNHAVNLTSAAGGAHKHTVRNAQVGYDRTGAVTGASRVCGPDIHHSSNLYPTTYDAPNHTHKVTGNTANTGSGSSFETTTPYTGVFYWKRIK